MRDRLLYHRLGSFGGLVSPAAFGGHVDADNLTHAFLGKLFIDFQVIPWTRAGSRGQLLSAMKPAIKSFALDRHQVSQHFLAAMDVVRNPRDLELLQEWSWDNGATIRYDGYSGHASFPFQTPRRWFN